MRFSKSHEWVDVQGKIATIGITTFAQKELGEIVYVEFPEIGKQVKAAEPVCVLESTKAAVDVYSPISGKILEVNIHLRSSPHLVNEKAENEGWLYRIEPSDLEELKTLMDAKQYLALCANSE